MFCTFMDWSNRKVEVNVSNILYVVELHSDELNIDYVRVYFSCEDFIDLDCSMIVFNERLENKYSYTRVFGHE